ncbi:MAG TPA: cation transporter, partial [Desulfobacterales bacterium]|nr:cation transporter [Desulfobacterales bacterium]
MESIQKKRFRIQNLDCAACAAKIERELEKTEGVESVALDFANLTLHLKTTDISKAMATVARIEPDVKLFATDQDDKHAQDSELSDSGHFQKQIGIIVAAGSVFVVHLIFEDKLHSLPWSWVEYPVMIV